MSKLRWVVGRHSCLEALKSRPSWIDEIAYMQGREKDIESLNLSKALQKKVKTRKINFFEDLGEGHQGIALAMNQRPRWEQSGDDKQCVAFLDGLTDPHNVGAIMRTAWLFNISVLFVPKNRTVKLTPTVCKIASGGAEHVALEEVHFQSQIKELKDEGFWIFGLSEQGDRVLYQQNMPEKTAWIIGSEGAGLRSSTINFCDELVAIPQVSQEASLNASVAFSLAGYEYLRTWHK